MSVRILDASMGELMLISALEREGDDLVIRGKIYGSMPIKAKLPPEEMRQLRGLLTFRLVWFVFFTLFAPTRGTKGTRDGG